MKKIFIFITILVFFLEGCSMNQNNTKNNNVKSNKEPNTRAFNDSFTKEFIQSPKEVLPGYYTFHSKTGRYSLALPNDSIIDESTYTLRKKDMELFTSNIRLKNFNPEELNATLDIKYFSGDSTDSTKITLENLQTQFDHTLAFKTMDFKTHTIYWDHYEQSEDQLYGLVGYVQNTENTGGLLFDYYFYCHLDEDVCKKHMLDFNEQETFNWLKTIKFTDY